MSAHQPWSALDMRVNTRTSVADAATADWVTRPYSTRTVTCSVRETSPTRAPTRGTAVGAE